MLGGVRFAGAMRNERGGRAFAASALAFAALAAAPAVETISSDQIRPGMRGYGLSVFQGTKPERFDVEVVDVLRNAFPKMDLILIRCAGQGLEKTKVIAGMSGSPIYLEGKLAGALSYGWTFSNEPIAGVTPIGNMLAELERPSEFKGAALPAAPGFGEMRPVSVPISVSGCPPSVLPRLRERFARFGWEPVQGGGNGASILRGGPEPTLEPGAALGVQLVRGDWDWTAIGTVTWTDGKRLVAFGHPFLQGGEIRAPMTTAYIHGVFSGLGRSFKFGSAVREAGTLVQDRLPCVVGDTTPSHRMLPLRMAITNRRTGARHEYKIEMVRNELILPLLLEEALFTGISTAETFTEEADVTADFVLRIGLAGKDGKPGEPIERRDRFLASALPYTWDLTDPFYVLLFNSLGKVPVESMEVEIAAEAGNRTARIERARFLRRRAAAGERVPLEVVFRPFREREVSRVYEVEVPRDAAGAAWTVRAGPAQRIDPDPAPAETAEDIVRKLRHFRPGTALGVSWEPRRSGLWVQGRSVRNLPNSYLEAFLQAGEGGASRAAEPEVLVFDTPWIVDGAASASIEIDRRAGR